MKDVVTYVICFLCVMYDILYQILTISSLINYLKIAKVPASLPQDKNMNFLS